MSIVNHINYPNDKGEIYCKKLNKIIKLDSKGKFWDSCRSCTMFSGDYQGQGVECTWEDDSDGYSEYVSDPVKERLRVAKLNDSKKPK